MTVTEPADGIPDVPVRNQISGTVTGPVVQASVIHGGVHVHVHEAPPHVPRQLPAPVLDIVDRTAAFSALTRCLADDPHRDDVARIGVIDGTAGVGKTALALHWAHSMRDCFPDGQLYVNLLGFDPVGTPLTPAEALQALLEGIGVPPDRVPVTSAGRAGMYRDLLAGRRILVVLDNAAESTQVEPLLPGPGAAATLVTSRNRLDGLIIHHRAERVELGVLNGTHSRDLLTRHLGPERDAGQPHVVDEIAASCGHLPLALSIVAARARLSPHMPLNALADQLRDTGAQLDALDTGDLVTSIRTVFSWSYGQLPGAAAKAFRLLGLHLGPDFGLATAESLMAMSNHETLQQLRALARANLLEQYMPNRFRFHDLLRVYAAERAQADEPAEIQGLAVRRFLSSFLHSARNAGAQLNPIRREQIAGQPEPGTAISRFATYEDAMNWFKEEYQNLTATIQWTAAHDFDEFAWQLTLVFWQYLYLCGRWHEMIDLHQTALAAAERLANVAAAAAIHTNLGIAMAMLGGHEEGIGHLRVALDQYGAAGDLDGQGNALDSLAWAHTQTADFETAISSGEQALAVYRQNGDHEGQARALDSIGVAYAGLGRCEEGLAYGHQALDLHRETGSRIGQAHVLRNIGRCYVRTGRYQEAITQFEQALALCREIGDRHDEANNLRDLGAALHASGADDQARAHLEQAIVILDELRHPDVQAVQAELAATLSTSADPQA